MTQERYSIINDARLSIVENSLLKRETKQLYLDALRILEESREGYRKLADYGLSSILINPDGEIMRVNSTFAQYLNSTPKELIGRKIVDHICKRSIDDWNNCFEQIKQATDTCNIKGEICLSEQSGLWIQGNLDERYLFSISLRYINNAGTPEIVISGVDITETFKAQEKASLLEKMACLGQMASGLAHEIKTPLQYVGTNLKYSSSMLAPLISLIKTYQNAIDEYNNNGSIPDDLMTRLTSPNNTLMLEDILQEKEEDTEIMQAISESIEGVSIIQQIITAMNCFSHPRGDGYKMANLNDGLRTIRIFSRNEWKYDADLIIEKDNNLPDIYCNPFEINQALLNMVINATHSIKDTGKHGKITLKTSYDDANVYVSVTDTGTGIDEETARKVFEPFFTTKEVGKGTGQGLFIANESITNQGGKIKLDSIVGKGTTFTIIIPRNNDEKH